MTLITNARTITLANAMTDAKALVNCKDQLGIATMGTDFIFDALNPSCYVGGALPAVSAAIPSAGLLGAVITAAGSGGANGTFALGITGGSGTGAAGTFTVAGGALTDITITNAGSGFTSNPAFSFAASAGLTGATATPFLASLLNVARDVQPALSRAKPVGAYPNSFAAKPTFDGKGLAFVNASTVPLFIAKGGVPINRVAESTLEGMIDYLEIVVAKATSFPSNVAPYTLTSGGGGFNFASTGVPQCKETSANVGAAIPTGKIFTLAKAVRLNVGANTSLINGYVGVDGIVTPLLGITGKVPSTYPNNSASQYAILGGGDGGSTRTWNGSIFYVYRELIGVSGRSDADVLALVQQVHAASLTRYA